MQQEMSLFAWEFTWQSFRLNRKKHLAVSRSSSLHCFILSQSGLCEKAAPLSCKRETENQRLECPPEIQRDEFRPNWHVWLKRQLESSIVLQIETLKRKLQTPEIIHQTWTVSPRDAKLEVLTAVRWDQAPHLRENAGSHSPDICESTPNTQKDGHFKHSPGIISSRWAFPKIGGKPPKWINFIMLPNPII